MGGQVMIKMKRFPVFLDEITLKELEAIAKDYGIDRGSMMRVFVLRGIKEYKEKQNG
jgi:metal-responsive CopG/Arc/MetJ family transcriptional regulator